MALRYKMFAYISAFILTLGMLIIGVFAFQNVQVNMGGDLIFNAEDVNAKISGSVTGAVENPELPDLHFKIENTDEELQALNANIEKWRDNPLQFDRTDSEIFNIVITITVENLSARPLNVKIIDSVGSSANVIKTIKRDGETYNSGDVYPIDGSLTTTFTITFEIDDKMQSLSGVKYGYIIDLSDESYVPPVQSNNEELGSVSYKDNGDGSITLTAKPKENAFFVGWQDKKGEFININTLDYNQLLIFSMFPGSGISINKFFDNYFVDYYQIDDENPAFETLISQLNTNPYIDPMILKDINIEADNIRNNYHKFDYEYFYGDCFTAIFMSKNGVSNYTQESDYDYMIFNEINLAVVTKYKGSSTEITIPRAINGNNVIGIYQDYSSFSSMYGYNVQWCPNNITKVTLPETFLEIGLYEYCRFSLNEINLPNSLLNIKGYAFESVSLNMEELYIPQKVKTIEVKAFLGNNAKSIVFDENSQLEIIGDDAFSESNGVTNITLPKKIKYIGNDVFSGLSVKLATLTFTGTMPPILGNYAFNDKTNKIYVPSGCEEAYKEETSWQSYKDMVYSVERKIENKDFAFHVNDDNLTLEVIYLKNNNLTQMEIPSNVNGKNVTSIGNFGFSYCSSIEIITIPASVTSIGSYAFESCSSLTNITIPSSVTSIGNSAFQFCSSLTNITIPSSVTSIGNSAFYGCESLTSVTFENTTGWQVSSSTDFSSYTELSSEDLKNTATAATYLKSNYLWYYWRRVA